MASNRVSTAYVEVVGSGVASNRVSTAYAEVVGSGVPKNRVSTAYAEVIGSGVPKNRISTAYVELIGDPAPPFTPVTARSFAASRATAVLNTGTLVIRPAAAGSFAASRGQSFSVAAGVNLRPERWRSFSMSSARAAPPITNPVIVSLRTRSFAAARSAAGIVTNPGVRIVASQSTARSRGAAAFGFSASPTVSGRSFASSSASAGARLKLVTPFPVLPGLGWSVHRRPTFDTIVAPHPSGAEVRSALWSAPLWEFELSYDGLAGDARFPGLGTQSLQALMGFYLSCGGTRRTFVFIDPDFSSLTRAAIGVGDGVTTVFPLTRAIGGFVEPISWSLGVSEVLVAGSLVSGWSQVAPVSIALGAPPAAGLIVAATFNYGFACRFMDDTLDFDEFMLNLWQLKSLKFRQVRAPVL